MFLLWSKTMLKKIFKAILEGFNLYPNTLNKGYHYVLYNQNNSRR